MARLKRIRDRKRYSSVSLADDSVPGFSLAQQPLSLGGEFSSVTVSLQSDSDNERFRLTLTAAEWDRLAAFVERARKRANDNASSHCQTDIG